MNPTHEPDRSTTTRADATSTTPHRRSRRRRDELGEGVISTAIAVLIVAFLGIALWKGFNGVVSSATTKTRAQVEQIGR